MHDETFNMTVGGGFNARREMDGILLFKLLIIIRFASLTNSESVLHAWQFLFLASGIYRRKSCCSKAQCVLIL